MMVKICGITSLDDALAAVDGGATALGFNFYSGSPRFIDPADAAAIGSRVPGGVLKVGVFVDEKPDTVRRIAGDARLDIAQLHGGEAPAGLRHWRACRVGGAGDFTCPDANGAEAILLDTAVDGLHGGTGRTFAWEVAPSKVALASGLRIIVAGGLDASNVGEAIRAARPWGVDACSRLESSPGRKDHTKMIAFIHAALAEAI